MKYTTKVLFLALMGLLMASCSSAFQPTTTPTPTLDPDAPVYTIQLTEFFFTPDRINLKVGQDVTFHVVNAGATDHELMIGRNPLRDESGELGDGFEHDFFAPTQPKVTGEAEVMDMGSGGMGMESATPSAGMAMDTTTPGGDMGNMEMENGFMVSFKPGQEATIRFKVNEDMLGTWTMGCFEVSMDQVHFDQGMVGNVIVESE